MKGFLLAGTRSGIGKTTVSMGLMSVFKDVSPFKVGPDYIDPSFHEFVTGNKSYNLDLFLMKEEGVKHSFYSHHKGISIVEGVMGLYDGLGNDLNNCSSAHVAKTLGLPVILVVDAIGKSTSIAAEVLGYKLLDPEINIAGIIINRVSSEKLYKMLKEAIEIHTGIKCFGYLKKDENINISSRHLGLLQANEVGDLKEKIELLKSEILKTIDIAGIEEVITIKNSPVKEIFEEYKNKFNGMKMGIARDNAFSFYYKDNLELLEKMGIQLIEFSPMKD
ncbi:MAG: cobyrinate a,c-diamide synthase, partial [Cetobacterium sp.]